MWLRHCWNTINSWYCLDKIWKKSWKSDETGVKSDNASSYHPNFCVEALYFLCKSKGIKLVRYDFNEPCHGKDQCDCKAAGAKSLIRNYIDAGHDVLCAEDIYAALHYGNGMKNFAVAVAQAEEKNTLTGIKNLKNYTISFFWVSWHSYGIWSCGVTLALAKVLYGSTIQ